MQPHDVARVRGEDAREAILRVARGPEQRQSRLVAQRHGQRRVHDHLAHPDLERDDRRLARRERVDAGAAGLLEPGRDDFCLLPGPVALLARPVGPFALFHRTRIGCSHTARRVVDSSTRVRLPRRQIPVGPEGLNGQGVAHAHGVAPVGCWAGGGRAAAQRLRRRLPRTEAAPEGVEELSFLFADSHSPGDAGCSEEEDEGWSDRRSHEPSWMLSTLRAQLATQIP